MPAFPNVLYPMINGNRYDFTSIEIGIDGIPSVFAGITSISYSQGIDGKDVRGNRPQPIGRTRGTYTVDANMTIAKAEYVVLMNVLAAKGAPLDQGFMEVAFDIRLVYGESGQFVTDEIRGCRIKKASTDAKEGGDAIMVKVDLHPMLIIENGQPAFTPSKLLR